MVSLIKITCLCKKLWKGPLGISPLGITCAARTAIILKSTTDTGRGLEDRSLEVFSSSHHCYEQID